MNLFSSTAPIELWFAAQKSRDINPRHVKTGKQHFQQLAGLAVQRAREIPKAHRLLFWHHCLLEAYRYLSYQ